MPAWYEALDEEAGSRIVVLDGKNVPHSVWSALKARGLPAHIFVASSDGEHRHNPAFKGNDYAEFHRPGELECIRILHDRRGVGALIVVGGMCTHESELTGTVEQIRQINPEIKIVTMGSFQFPGEAIHLDDPNDTSTLIEKLQSILPPVIPAERTV